MRDNAKENEAAEGGAMPRAPRREVQWRRRAKRLAQMARDAQFELMAKTIRYSALAAVMTEAEVAHFNARIKQWQAERRAAGVSRLSGAPSHSVSACKGGGG